MTLVETLLLVERTLAVGAGLVIIAGLVYALAGAFVRHSEDNRHGHA
jgi:hypothetical protein